MIIGILHKTSRFFWLIIAIEFFLWIYFVFDFVYHQKYPPIDNSDLVFKIILSLQLIGVLYLVILLIVFILNLVEKKYSTFIHNLIKFIVQILFLIALFYSGIFLLVFGL